MTSPKHPPHIRIRLGLQIRFLLTFLAVSLIPIISLAINNYLTLQNTLLEDADRALGSTATQVTLNIDNLINTNLDIIRTEALLPDLVNYLSLTPEERNGSSQEANARRTLQMLSRKNQISSYALLDINGIDILDTYTQDIGINKTNRSYFKEPLRTGLPYVSPLLFSETTHKPSIYFSSPVRDETGQIIGILRARYNITIIQQILARLPETLGKNSNAMLIDENQIILINSANPELNFTLISALSTEKITELQQQQRLPSTAIPQPDPNLLDFAQALRNAQNQPYFSGKVGEILPPGAIESPKQVAIQEMSSHPWQIVLIMPQQEFLAPLNQQLSTTLISIGIIILIVIVLALISSYTFSQPLLQLTAVAQRITSGDWTARAHIADKFLDEIALLGAAFNSMTTKLQQSMDDLTQKNLQLQHEIMERQQAEDALEFNLKFERTLTEISRIFVKLEPESTNQGIQESLHTIGEYLGADHCYIWLNTSGDSTTSSVYEWCAPNIQSSKELYAEITPQRFPWLFAKLQRQENILLPSLDTLPPEAALEQQILAKQGIQSLLWIPMLSEKNLYGLIGLDTTAQNQSWTSDNALLLHIASDTFVGALERRRIELERNHLQQEIITAQERLIQELSTPIIPILDQMIILPLVGTLNEQRARNLTRTLIAGITHYRARIVILDLTGVPVMDQQSAELLSKTVQAARLKGAQTIVTGLSNAVAETMVELNIDTTSLETAQNLQNGLLLALEKIGGKLIRPR